MIPEGGKGLSDSFEHYNKIARIYRVPNQIAALNVKSKWLQYSTALKTEEKKVVYTPLFRELIATDKISKDTLANLHGRMEWMN